MKIINRRAAHIFNSNSKSWTLNYFWSIVSYRYMSSRSGSVRHARSCGFEQNNGESKR